MSVIKNIIFDWSGTLADDFQPVLQATNEIFVQYGKPEFTEEEFREKFYLPFPEFYQEYLPEATMVQLDHYYHSSFKLLQDNIELLPDAENILTYCQQQGMKIFLLSTIHQEHYDIQAERLGVKKYFTQAYVQAIDKRRTILQLLAEHDLNPQETLFVGDMQHDIETARHGSVKSCAVLTGYDPLEKLTASSPDLIFKDLAGVLSHLKEFRCDPDYYPVATVGALIFNTDDQVLMIRTYKWSNLWGIPGGKIKTDEPAQTALVREVKEETNLDVNDVEFVMVHDCIHSQEFFKPAHFLLLNYTAHTDSNDVTLNEEADEYRWVSIEEAYQLPLNTPTRALLDEIVRRREAVIA
ncbi:MAG: HAD hydrolase-like protein [Verrucomicrobiota bacterium]